MLLTITLPILTDRSQEDHDWATIGINTTQIFIMQISLLKISVDTYHYDG